MPLTTRSRVTAPVLDRRGRFILAGPDRTGAVRARRRAVIRLSKLVRNRTAAFCVKLYGSEIGKAGTKCHRGADPQHRDAASVLHLRAYADLRFSDIERLVDSLAPICRQQRSQ